jgi:hypothetical protein
MRMRAQIGDIAAEVIRAIRTEIPDYARPRDSAYQRSVEIGVEGALRFFLDRLEGKEEGNERWREQFAAIGAGEAVEGRSLDTLQSALRLGARVSWRWLVAFAEHEAIPLHALGLLAEAIFTFLDQLANAAAQGYLQGQALEAGELERRRRRLLEVLLADPPPSTAALTAIADAASWAVPRRLAVVAVGAQVAMSAPPMLPPDILVGFERPEPCLIVPDPDSPTRRRLLQLTVVQHPAVIGPTVSPAEAGRSLRWARDALALAHRGILPSDQLLWCSDHLAELMIFRDEELLSAFVERRLAPLAQLRDGQRDAMTDTLLAWLQLDKSASDVAARLHVHPQTVRYRLRRLEELFGAQLRDPAVRFELEIALRAEQSRR